MNKTNGKANCNKSQTIAGGRVGYQLRPPMEHFPVDRQPDPFITYMAPYSTVLVSQRDLVDQSVMRSAQLATVLGTLPSDSYPEYSIHLARDMADVLADVISNSGDSLDRSRQLQSLLHSLHGENGPCVLLWLCQQLCDEVVAVVGALGLPGASYPAAA